MSSSSLRICWFVLLLCFCLPYCGTLACDFRYDFVTKFKHVTKRNILLYPPSSVLQITMGITLAENLERNNAVVVLGFQQNADLPKEPQPVFLSPEVIKARRFSVFHYIKKILNRYGYNGMECLKKMICQSAKTPAVGGLLEEIISFVLAPSKHRSATNSKAKKNMKNEESEVEFLMEAENLGKSGQNCTDSFPLCDRTPFDWISSLILL